MGWMLYNLSRNCPKNVEKPDCGFRGMPVQVNSDSCCPEWECPCKSFYMFLLCLLMYKRLNSIMYMSKITNYDLEMEDCLTVKAPA